MSSVLILGYGNPLRGDDGAGWAVVARLRERLQARSLPVDVETLVQHQLLPEMIPTVSEVELAIFVDAAATGVPGLVQVQPVLPGDSLVKPFTHQLDPETVVANALALYGRAPRAVLVTISGQSFGYEEVLTDVVETAVAEAVTTIEKIIGDWRAEIPKPTSPIPQKDISMTPPKIASQITFLYYRDLAAAQHFYETVLGLKPVEDQGWAKIYQIDGAAFLGIVDETQGSLKVKEDSAVMVTMVVDDVLAWYEYLREQDVVIRRELGKSDEIQIEYFFIEDPGGYVLEFQKFLKPQLAKVFGLSVGG